jgi:lipoprotein LpqB-like beta-propeller protein/sporulation and spore germination protein
MTVRGWLAAACALMLGAGVAACATVPTSGSISVSSLHDSGGSGQTGVQIEPVPPGRAWNPQQIVSGFLAASASPKYSAAGARPDYSVARRYLTKAYSRRWRPGWAATIIDSPTTVPNHVPAKGPIPTGPQGASIRVTGQHLATLQATGKYQPGSIVVAPTSTQFLFALEQVAGQWRIDDVEKDGKQAPTLLLLTQPDFDRDYQPRNLYFYGPGKDASALVPEPVYIPQQAGSRGIVEGLVGALLNPPRGRRNWLHKAVTTAFPPGTVQIGNPQVSGGLAVVNLGGAAAKAPRDQRLRMEAQLYWSLTYSPYPAQTPNPITSVLLKVNGQQVSPLSSSAYSRYLPQGVGTPLYYQVPGEQARPAVVMLPSDSRPVSVPVPTALGDATFAHVAVSTAEVGSAVVAGCRGKAVYLLPQSRRGVVITRSLPSGCTSLSWDVHGNLWVATESQIFEIPGAGSRPPASPTLLPVQVPKYPHGKFLALRVAPDGVRVALIVHAGSATTIQVAAISKLSDITYLAQERQMLPVGPDIAHPIALTWQNPDHLLVLGQQGATRTVLYQVPLDGAKSTEVPTPGGVMSVAAGLQANRQRVVVAIAPPTDITPGKIEMSTTDLSNPDWRLQVKGITPVFPG